MVSRGQIYVESKRYAQYSPDTSVAYLVNTAGCVILSVWRVQSRHSNARCALLVLVSCTQKI
jgi:hypothetical protein